MTPKSPHPVLTGWRDRPAAYGRVSRLFHWIMAAYLLWQFGIMLAYKTLGQSDPLNAIAGWGPSHGMVGLVVIVLVLFRAAWAIANRHNRAKPQGAMERLARAVHVGMYALMFLIPALGFLRAYGSGKGWPHMGMKIIPGTGEEIGWMIWLGDLAHGELAWALAVLIAGHAGMAIWHQVVMRDGTLSKMAGRRAVAQK